MFDLGWSELLLIGVVALIVVGPKDLPNMFRALGQFMGKARKMAREFSRAMESAADDAGVKEINKTLRAAVNPAAFGTDKLRDLTGLNSPAYKPGSETAKLSAEREEAKRKITEATAKAATERKAREAAAAGVAGAEPVAAPEALPAPALPATASVAVPAAVPVAAPAAVPVSSGVIAEPPMSPVPAAAAQPAPGLAGPVPAAAPRKRRAAPKADAAK